MKPSAIPDMPMAEYLALPAVGQGVLSTLIGRCPYAAWWESYLNPKRPRDDSTVADKGTVAHAILLEGSESCCEVVRLEDHPNEKGGGFAQGWTNKSIKAKRDDIRRQGKIPILAGDMAEVRAMVDAACMFIGSLRETEPMVWATFQRGGGESELTLVWEAEDIRYRARPDRISADRSLVCHVKTVTGTAEPDAWGRTHLAGQGYYLTAAFYQWAVAQAFGVEECEQKFVVVEQEPPHLCSLIGVSPAHMTLGAAKMATAREQWKRCAERNHWPAYPSVCVYPDLPSYETVKWEEREIATLSLDERLSLGSQA